MTALTPVLTEPTKVVTFTVTSESDIARTITTTEAPTAPASTLSVPRYELTTASTAASASRPSSVPKVVISTC